MKQCYSRPCVATMFILRNHIATCEMLRHMIHFIQDSVYDLKGEMIYDDIDCCIGYCNKQGGFEKLIIKASCLLGFTN